MSMTRIEQCFTRLKAQNKTGFIGYIMAGDPNYEQGLEILMQLPQAGIDIIELGMPFSDPMADGPAIQEAALRALAAGQTMQKTLDMVRAFRAQNNETPLILMGYYNPIYHYGADAFLRDAKSAGVDGLLVVDLPPEEDTELCLPARAAGLDFIRLATPTSDAKRLSVLLHNSSGFIYYVSITGTTGAATPQADHVAHAITRIRHITDLPIAVGFGIKTPAQAARIAQNADAVVVGSVLVDCIKENMENPCDAVLALTAELATSVHHQAKGEDL